MRGMNGQQVRVVERQQQRLLVNVEQMFVRGDQQRDVHPVAAGAALFVGPAGDRLEGVELGAEQARDDDRRVVVRVVWSTANHAPLTRLGGPAALGLLINVWWAGQLDSALLFIGIVWVEVLVLAINGWRCPLTAVAARYTNDRQDNFDIYLPVWLARNNKTIFGALLIGGMVFTAARWLGWL